ncbi:MAG: citrate lyase subunit alpha [Peptostreptococcaceae bacterium]|nr:citrate lyase subunit alpha [Peptostreptococcaceae bacterium]
MINKAGREIPQFIDDYKDVSPYAGAFESLGERIKTTAKIKSFVPGSKKLLATIDEAIEKTGLKDGMTVSFHHHLRNGDQVVNLVMAAIAAKGIKDIHIAVSGIFAVHEPLVKMMEDGVVTKVTTSTFNPGPVAKAITAGKLKKPAVLMSHGGRPRAIECGELHIDVAFIGAPSCDEYGNMNGTHGKSACGFLSYAYADAMYANNVVAVTDTLVPYPCCPIEISQEKVDFVVQVESIGDPKGIVSGTLTITDDPIRLKIADDTIKLADAAGYIKNGMSFQTGASSTALAVAAGVREIMKERKIVGSFGLGGIHSYFVKMLEEGLFKNLFDTQCFDIEAIRSAAKNEKHMGISGSQYANPHNRGSVVNNLDLVILGATEIDTDFNVNVITGTNGVIMGASGGHSDCAAGSKMAIIVTNLTRKNFCIVRDKVTTITTPGETIDAVVTEYGIAINPRRKDLLEAVKNSDLPIIDIHDLKTLGESLVGEQTNCQVTDKIVAVVEYRDGTVIDTVKMPL